MWWQQNRHVKFTYDDEAIMEMVDRDLLRADQILAEVRGGSRTRMAC